MEKNFDARTVAETGRTIISVASMIGIDTIIVSVANAFVPMGGGIIGGLQKLCVHVGAWELSCMAGKAIGEYLQDAVDSFVEACEERGQESYAS